MQYTFPPLILCGIYHVVNVVNGHSYVGMSTNIKRRLSEHKSKFKHRNYCPSFSAAIRKHGLGNFSFSVLGLYPESDLSRAEQFWIGHIKPEYNRTDGGIGCKGLHLTQEVRKILSDKGKAQWNRKSECEKLEFVAHNLKGPRLGHTVSQATRQKIRAKLIGFRMPKETRAKIGGANRISMLGNTNGRFNKTIKAYEQTTTH